MHGLALAAISSDRLDMLARLRFWDPSSSRFTTIKLYKHRGRLSTPRLARAIVLHTTHSGIHSLYLHVNRRLACPTFCATQGASPLAAASQPAEAAAAMYDSALAAALPSIQAALFSPSAAEAR